MSGFRENIDVSSRDDRGEKIYTCRKCHFRTSSEMNALCHVRVCHAAIPSNYICDQCGFKTNNEDQLRLHSLVRHSFKMNKTYQCSECTFSSVDKVKLLHHIHANHFIACSSSSSSSRGHNSRK